MERILVPLASSLGVGVAAVLVSMRHPKANKESLSRAGSGPPNEAAGAAATKSDAETMQRGGSGAETAPSAAGAQERGGTQKGQNAAQQALNLKKVEVYKDQIAKNILSPEAITVTLEGFPYYMSESTKTLLVNSAFVHLKRTEFVKYAAQLSTISPRILLVGPTGSEAYQETTVKALAKKFSANLLIFDNQSITLEVEYPMTPRVAPLGKNFDDDDLPPLDSLEDEASIPDGDGAGLKLDDLKEPTVKEFLNWVQEQLGSPDEGARPVSADQKGSPSKPPVPLGKVLTLLQEYGGNIERTSSGGKLERTASASRLERTSSCDSCVRLSRASSTDSTTSFVEEVNNMKIAAAAAEAAERLKAAEAKEPVVPAKRALELGDRIVFVGSTTAKNGTFSQYGAYHGKLVKKRDTEPNLGIRFDKPFPGGHSLNGECEDGLGYYCYEAELRLEGASDDDKALIAAFFQVLETEGADEPLIVYIRDAEKWLLSTYEAYTTFKERVEKVKGRVLVIASYTEPKEQKEAPKDAKDEKKEEKKGPTIKVPTMLAKLFPSEIGIQPPQDENSLEKWKRQMKIDAEKLRADANRALIRKILTKSGIKSDGLSHVNIKDRLLTEDMAKKLTGWAANDYLTTTASPEVRNGKLVISAKSLEKAIETLKATEDDPSTAKKALQDVVIDNDFEKALLSEVIPPNEIGVNFSDIGALQEVKDTLRELVMLPLQWQDLFSKSSLTKPCKGILLFGPPGTGKTMLAKAVATEAGANFINVSMSKITSKWFGEDEKYVRALFTLASKISPSVIFVDEVDSMLGRRDSRHEAEAMRKIKNEFMTCWDGLRTREKDRVLVLAATNRPFDLDEAVLRRFPRRMMIPLPDKENRARILRVILSQEELAKGFDFDKLAQDTEGYSGSDLKNMCVAAAYRPVRELLDSIKDKGDKGKNGGAPNALLENGVRSITMEDITKAMEQVGASVSKEAQIMQELEQWNEQYGEGGSRKKQQLSYFM